MNVGERDSMEDTLTIGYDNNEPMDIPALTVARVRAGQVCVLKSVYGEEALRLYEELTEQEANAT